MIVPDELLFHPAINLGALKFWATLNAISGITKEVSISFPEMGYHRCNVRKWVFQLKKHGFLEVDYKRGRKNRYKILDGKKIN